MLLGPIPNIKFSLQTLSPYIVDNHLEFCSNVSSLPKTWLEISGLVMANIYDKLIMIRIAYFPLLLLFFESFSNKYAKKMIGKTLYQVVDFVVRIARMNIHKSIVFTLSCLFQSEKITATTRKAWYTPGSQNGPQFLACK